MISKLMGDILEDLTNTASLDKIEKNVKPAPEAGGTRENRCGPSIGASMDSGGGKTARRPAIYL